MYDKIIPEAIKAFTGALDKYLQQGAGTLEKFYMLAYKQNYFYAGADMVAGVILLLLGVLIFLKGWREYEGGLIFLGAVFGLASSAPLYHAFYRLFCPEMATVRDMLNIIQNYVK